MNNESTALTDDPHNLEKKSEHVGVLTRMCAISQTGHEKAIKIMEQIKVVNYIILYYIILYYIIWLYII